MNHQIVKKKFYLFFTQNSLRTKKKKTFHSRKNKLHTFNAEKKYLKINQNENIMFSFTNKKKK